MGSCMSSPEPAQKTAANGPSKPPASNATPTANAPGSSPTTGKAIKASDDDSGAGGSSTQGMAAALASPENGASAQRSNAIDRQLEDDQRKIKKECKILLLGTLKPKLDPESSQLISQDPANRESPPSSNR